jgi:hypothetical protein
MPLDDLTQKTHNELETVASKHSSFEGFLQDVQRLAETVWHNARSKGHDPASIVGDVEESLPDLEQAVTDAEQVLVDTRAKRDAAVAKASEPESNSGSTPAEPASPVSEGGFPTTNVDIHESQPVQH